MKINMLDLYGMLVLIRDNGICSVSESYLAESQVWRVKKTFSYVESTADFNYRNYRKSIGCTYREW